MEFVDSTALATALPTMAEAFAVPPEALKMALTTYVLALAVFMPASGWLADRLGAKRVYIGAMSIFCVGSLACALSASLPALVAARALQGLGGSLMASVGRIIILHSTPRSELVSAMNWFTMPAQLGPLLGPPIAGLVLAVADWRWIFLINLPIAALGAMAIARFVSNEPLAEARDFDFLGYVLAAAAITLFIGATEAAGTHAPAGSMAAAVLCAIVIGVLYLWHARRTEHPVLDVRLLTERTFCIAMLGGTLARLAVGASPLLLPLLLQIGLGFTPLQSGLVVMGQPIGTLLAKAVSIRALRRFSFRKVLIASNLAAAAATMLPALYGIRTPAWTIFVLMIATGLTRSLQFTVNNTVAFAHLPSNRLSGASTLSSVIQQVGFALGISVGGLLLHISRSAHHGALTAAGFAMPFITIGIVAAGAALVYGRLHPGAGENLRGRTGTGQAE